MNAAFDGLRVALLEVVDTFVFSLFGWLATLFETLAEQFAVLAG